MQTYNNIYEIAVDSKAHGKRTFVTAVHSLHDAWEAITMIVEPWSGDEDFTLTVKRPKEDVFIAVTDRAYRGNHVPPIPR